MSFLSEVAFKSDVSARREYEILLNQIFKMELRRFALTCLIHMMVQICYLKLPINI